MRRVREGRIPWATFSPCASFHDRVLRLCSIRDGVNRGNRRRYAAIAAAAAAAIVVGCIYATAGWHLGKTFPKAQFPRSGVGASYAYAFGGRSYRSAAAAAATYVHPVHNARKVHVRWARVCSLLWKATGKSEPLWSNSVAASR